MSLLSHACELPLLTLSLSLFFIYSPTITSKFFRGAIEFFFIDLLYHNLLILSIQFFRRRRHCNSRCDLLYGQRQNERERGRNGKKFLFIKKLLIFFLFFQFPLCVARFRDLLGYKKNCKRMKQKARLFVIADGKSDLLNYQKLSTFSWPEIFLFNLIFIVWAKDGGEFFWVYWKDGRLNF